MSELRTRDVSKLSTSRLYSLADSFRRQIVQSTGQIRFTAAVRDIPLEERIEKVHDWTV